ncbi:MAG: serine/threonine-protein kinase [Candidatus Krumholzibacteriia bacterium]
MADESIGNYRVLRKLGAGGMASVYLASHRDVPNLRTVLKELSDPQLADRFRREADKLALLDGHRGICQIKHFFEAGGQFYIVMEYIEGPNLDELVRSDDPPDLPRVLDIARSVLSTLDFAHQQGVVHRDIKPTNIMIDRRGEVKIIDFGIAKGAADPDLTQVGASLGSPRYMAPEQFNPAGPIDWVRCDVYAVGVTLYYLLTRDFPFKVGSVYEMCEAKRLGTIVPPSQLDPSIPPWLEAVVLKAMATDPRDRFATAAEMRAALQDAGATPLAVPGRAPDTTMVLGATPPAAPAPAPPPPPAATPPTPPAADGWTGTPTPPPAAAAPGRRRALVVGGAVAAVALAAILGLILLRGGGGPPPPPTLVAPAADAVLAEPVVEFRWDDPDRSAGPHDLELAADSSFAAPQVRTGVTGGAFRGDEPLADGAWFWRVRAAPDGGEAGPWSAVGRFRVERPPLATATLIVPIEPGGAELLVDGTSVGTVSGRKSLTLAPGRHTLVARLARSVEKEISREVDLQPGEERTLTPPIRFQLPAPQPATRISITVVSLLEGQGIPGATIEIDGRMVTAGETPYVVELPTGSHRIVVKKTIDGRLWTGESDLVVRGGMDKTLRIDLQPPR